MEMKKTIQETKENIPSRETTVNTSSNRLNKQWPWIKKYRVGAAK
jgi:hypothetical protein